MLQMAHYETNKDINVKIPLSEAELAGILHIPENPQGLVLFAHGSGSSRYSKRNQHVAKILNKGKLATLLFDLLTKEEEAEDIITRQYRFNIPMLANRLVETANWSKKQLTEFEMNMGYFGSSTGGGAALIAAAKAPDTIKAVVSRGGRPDLAGDALPLVKAATLLIVGGNDDVVIDMNKDAMENMKCTVNLQIIPGATHLFEEPGTLDDVAQHAKDWFLNYLSPAVIN